MSTFESAEERRQRSRLDGGLSIVAGFVVGCAERGRPRHARIGIALEALAEPVRKGSLESAHVALVGRWARG